MNTLRALAFNVGFYGVAALVALLCVPLLLAPWRWMTVMGKIWVRFTLFWLKLTCNLDHEIRGWEKLPRDRRFILAAKHQSAWETLALWLLLDDPAVVLKVELTRIPLWGKAALHIGHVPVDRKAGAGAMRAMMELCRKRLAEGRPILIFPQGTRAAPGVQLPYHPGVAGLYRDLKVPVYPVALNSGLFWGRNSFAKRPGKITVEVLDPIQPGLDRREFLKVLAARIEPATAALEAEARAKFPHLRDSTA